MHRIALALLIAVTACLPLSGNSAPMIVDYPLYCNCEAGISPYPEQSLGRVRPNCIWANGGSYVAWCSSAVHRCTYGAAMLCTAGCVTDTNADSESRGVGRCIDPCDSGALLEPPARDADTAALLADIGKWSRRCDPGPPARLVRERTVDDRVETGPSEPCPDGCEELEVPSAHRYTQERIMVRIARCKVQCPAR